MVGLHHDVLADGLADQRFEAAHQRVDVQGLGPQMLSAREGQQLAGQARPRSAACRMAASWRWARSSAPKRRPSRSMLPSTTVKQIVEVVSDAAGELAHRLHLVRLDELLLQQPLLGDVENGAEDLRGSARRSGGASTPWSSRTRYCRRRSASGTRTNRRRSPRASAEACSTRATSSGCTRLEAEAGIVDEAMRRKAGELLDIAADERAPRTAARSRASERRSAASRGSPPGAPALRRSACSASDLLGADAEVLVLQPAAQLRLALDLACLEIEVDENRDLGLQDEGVDRLEHHVHGAGRIGLRRCELVAEDRGQEDDRNVTRALAGPDQLGRLVAVHARHVQVEQDDGERPRSAGGAAPPRRNGRRPASGRAPRAPW